MRKTYFLIFGAITLLLTGQVSAQLPANPWANQEPKVSAKSTTSTTETTAGADIGHISAPSTSRAYMPSIKYAPISADAAAPTYKPAVASTSYSNTRSSSQNSSNYAIPRSTASGSQGGSWRGSGQYGKLGYSGQVTTYDKAQGQEMIAPEINNQNMNVMVQHLRQLGYKIPASYDNKFSNFLQDYSADLRTAYSGLGRQHNPIDTMFNGILDSFEHFTGLDAGNLMFNSLDLIQRD